MPTGTWYLAVERITKRRDEASPAAGVLHSGLRVISDPPGATIERDNHPAPRLLPDLAIVGRVRLPRDREHFTHPNVRNNGLRKRPIAAHHANAELVKSTGGSDH